LKPRLIAALIVLALLTGISPELFGQKRKKFKEKRFEPVARENLKDYEGTYIGIDSTYGIEIRLGAEGRLIISTFENGRRATLENIKVEGAHLTATKIYTDGRTGKFDGTFSNRILNGESTFGILVDGMQVDVGGLMLNRIFYPRR
jgi:hypothetical protein